MPFLKILDTYGSVSGILKCQISNLLAHFLALKSLTDEDTILHTLRDGVHCRVAIPVIVRHFRNCL